MYKLGKGSKKVYNSGLHADLLLIIDTALKSAPMDFTLVSGFRKAKEQFELFKIGREFTGMGYVTNPHSWKEIPKGEKGYGVVTYCDGYVKKSRHQSGKAFDFQCYIPGRPDLAYDKVHMAVLIGAFITIGNQALDGSFTSHRLRSGADWDMDTEYLEPGTFIDLPHLELIKP